MLLRWIALAILFVPGCAINRPAVVVRVEKGDWCVSVGVEGKQSR